MSGSSAYQPAARATTGSFRVVLRFETHPFAERSPQMPSRKGRYRLHYPLSGPIWFEFRN